MKIAHVEDDSFLLNMYKVKFERAGFKYTPYLVKNGGDSIENIIEKIVVADVPDLVIFDVIMPGKNGFDFALELKEKSTIPFIFLTNASDSTDVDRAKELGALAYIIKATTIPSEVLDTVENILKKIK